MTYSLVMTTTETRAEAEALAETLVAGKLCACVQIVAIDSVYVWQDKPHKGAEFLLLIKGRTDSFPQLRDQIITHSSYTVPEVIRLDIADGSANYLAWMAAV